MNVGKYVCHHAIFNLNDMFSVGGRKFETLAEAVEFYKEHPLGDTTLTHEYAIDHGECREKVLTEDYNKKVSNAPTSDGGGSGHSPASIVHNENDESQMQTGYSIVEVSTVEKPKLDRKTPIPGLYYRDISTSSGKEIPLDESFVSNSDKQALIR